MAKILVVDDVKDVRESIEYFLKINGYEVVEATDGFDALCILREQKFDLVLTDLRMPGMTGIQLIQKVQATNPEQCFIAMSSDPSDKELGVLAAKNIYFLRKPFNPLAKLLLIVARAIAS